MNIKNLKQYLGYIYAAEKHLYTLDSAIWHAQNKAKELGYSANSKASVKFVNIDLGGLIINCIIAGIVSGILLGFLSWGIYISRLPRNVQWTYPQFFLVMLVSILVTLVVFILIPTLYHKHFVKSISTLSTNQWQLQDDEVYVTNAEGYEEKFIDIIIATIFIGPIIGLIVGVVWWIIFYRWAWGSLFVVVPAVLVICVVATTFFSILISMHSVMKKRKETDLENFEKVEEYKQNLRNTRARVSNELATKNVILANEDALWDKYNETNEILQSLYGLGVIHPKYRNLAAISSIYEYFDTGRVTTLEGVNGAYNLYESEYRLDRIITNLDIVISNLQGIREAQYYLFNALSDANNRIAKLTHLSQLSLDISKQNQQTSEIIAYNTQVTASNTAALKWFAIIDSMNR